MKKVLLLALSLVLMITMSSCDTLLDLFKPKVTLTIVTPTNGTITVSPQKTQYIEGDTVTLTATADSGYTFTSWTGSLSGTTNPSTLTLNSDASVGATFTATATTTTTTTSTTTTVSSTLGTVAVTIKKASDDTGLSGVSAVLKNSVGTQLSTATSGTDGSITMSNISPGSSYTMDLTKTGYVQETIANITVTAGTTTYLETVLQVATSATTGTVSGKITSALDGSNLSGAALTLRKGIDVQTGTSSTTGTTATDGTYSIGSLAAGNYTMQVSKTGFTTAYFTVVSLGGGLTKANQNFSITPVLNSSEVRFVLTWGASPSDLDSHLRVPTTTPSHVYYSNDGSSTSTPWALLDTDDTSSYGPETITIYTQVSGTYTYYVHDFTNRYSASSTVLSNSGATVKVYQGNSLLRTFYVPQQAGTLWKVCTWNGTTLAAVNTMLYEDSSSDVITRSLIDDAELAMFRNLPVK